MNRQRIFIYAGFLLSIFTLLGFALFYLNKLNRLNEYRNRVDHSYQIILQIGKLKENMLNAETGQRGFLITQDSAFLKPFLESHENIHLIFNELDSLTRSSSIQQKYLDTLKALIHVSSNLMQENLSYNKSPSEFSQQLKKGKYYMDKVRESMIKLKRREVLLLKQHDFKRQSTLESSTNSSYIILCIAFLVCFIGAIVIITFFNKILLYQKELRQHIYKLENLNKEIISLSFASSHNLQEPTRKIQILIDKLEYVKNASPAMIDENFSKIKSIFAKQQETNKLIINYYAILNRPTEMIKISLPSFMDELIETADWNKKALIQIHPLPDIFGDKEQIKRLFVSLIENSITFNPNQQDLKIEISEIPFTSISNMNLPNIQDGFHVICIADNGVGVPAELHEKIFELFQKTDDRTELASKPGMGLSFSKRIMLNHNGWIEAHDNTPNGFKIYLFFPIS